MDVGASRDGVPDRPVGAVREPPTTRASGCRVPGHLGGVPGLRCGVPGRPVRAVREPPTTRALRRLIWSSRLACESD